MKQLLDQADDAAPIRQHELDHILVDHVRIDDLCDICETLRCSLHASNGTLTVAIVHTSNRSSIHTVDLDRPYHNPIYLVRFFFAFLRKKKCLFRSRYTISSIIVAWETRLTENGIPPEPNPCWCKLNALD